MGAVVLPHRTLQRCSLKCCLPACPPLAVALAVQPPEAVRLLQLSSGIFQHCHRLLDTSNALLGMGGSPQAVAAGLATAEHGLAHAQQIAREAILIVHETVQDIDLLLRMLQRLRAGLDVPEQLRGPLVDFCSACRSLFGEEAPFEGTAADAPCVGQPVDDECSDTCSSDASCLSTAQPLL